MVAISFIAIGFMDYPLIAYHLEETNRITSEHIPLLYAMAMGVDAIAALIFGYLFDRKGIISLVYPIAIASLAIPIIFSYSRHMDNHYRNRPMGDWYGGTRIYF